jgi:hypothetical protein
MKKNLKYTVGSGALMLLTAVASVSCTEDNDWSVDSSTDRLFSVVSSTLSVSEGTTTADVKWTKTPNTEYYIIQVSADSLYDGVNLDSIDVVTYGEDGSIKGSPYTVENLIGSTKYFLRIQAASSLKASSKWTYLDKASFKTKAEQIMNDAENVTGRSALLSWTPGLAVTHLIMTYNYQDEAYRDSIVLDDEAKANGQYELTGLMSKKTYNVSIWNNDVQRGSVKFTTTEAYPEGYSVARVSTADELNALLTDPTTAVAAGGNLVIVFPASSTLNYISEESNLVVPSTVNSVVFWGESGGETPVFKPKGLSFEGNHDLVRFYNLDLQNAGNSSDYIVNQSKAGAIAKLLIEDCTVSKTRGVVRVQGDGANGSIDSLVINNCQISDIGSYAIVNSKISGFAWKAITLSNLTVNTVNGGGVIITQQPNYTINLENCTFYNCVTGTKSFIDSNKETGITVNVKKTIIGKSYGNKLGVTADDEGAVTIKATSLKIGEGFDVIDSDLYTTSDCPYTKNYSWGTILDYGSADLFKDPENGDFTLLKSLNAGDPRWIEE